MTTLKSLSFVSLPNGTSNPTLDRRARTIARLTEQKELLANPNYVRKQRSFVKENGVRKAVENEQRILRWWHHNIDGSCFFTIRSGSKAIEFEKGKAAIVVPSFEKLPAVIDTLIAATKAGELDTQLAQAARQRPDPKRA